MARAKRWAFAGQHPVRGIGNGARQLHRIFHVLHAGDRAQAAAGVYDRGVHFDRGAVQAQHGAAARVQAAIVFERGDGDDGGIERVAVDFQLPERASRGEHAGVFVVDGSAGTAVHHDGAGLFGVTHVVLFLFIVVLA